MLPDGGRHDALSRSRTSDLAAVVLVRVLPGSSRFFRRVEISQTATELKIETTRAHGSSAVVYKLDGSENKLADGTATTRWDGSTLITETVRDIKGVTVTTKESRSLNAAGNEMSVDTILVVQHGYSLRGTPNYGTGKDVFTRVRQ